MANQPDSAAPREGSAAGEAAGLVLVVEDDRDTMEAVCLLLESAGFGVASASNGLEALERLRASVKPNLIVTDLMMPIMDGWQLLARLKGNAEWAKIPVVVVSGAEARGEGVIACQRLKKPLNVDQFLQAVRDCVDHGRRPDRAVWRMSRGLHVADVLGPRSRR